MSAKRAEVSLRFEIGDPRDYVRKHASYGALQPHILREWFFENSKEISRIAEWVFWQMWDRACMTNNYLVAISIKELAAKLRVSESAVHRAIQSLIAAGALRRTRRAKAKGTFPEIVALSEVLIPGVVVSKLPNMRRRKRAEPRLTETTGPDSRPEAAEPETPDAILPPKLVGLITDKKLTVEEGAAWLAWKTGRAPAFEPTSGSPLSQTERAYLFAAQPHYLTPQKAKAASKSVEPVPRRTSPKPKILDTFSAERLRRKLSEMVPHSELEQRFQEITWSLKCASLSRQESLSHGINLGLKLIEKGVWNRPYGMPEK